MKDCLSTYESISPIERNFQVKLKLNRDLGEYHSHWHEHLELLYFISGECEIISGGIEYTVKAGDLFIVNSEERHSTNSSDGEHLCMHIFTQFFADIEFDDFVFEAHIVGDVFVKDCFERIYAEQQTKATAYDMRIKSVAYSLMAYLTCNYRKNSLSGSEALRRKNKLRDINEVFAYIAANYNTVLTTAELAKHFHLTEQYFCHIFKRETGQTPIDYINRYRVEKAAVFLKRTDQSITDIALRVGFEDSNYFSRVFKKYMGRTPREYRKYE